VFLASLYVPREGEQPRLLELLQRAAGEGFEVFVTADQNLQFKQNLGFLPQPARCCLKPAVFLRRKWDREFESIPLRHRVPHISDSPGRCAKLVRMRAYLNAVRHRR